ncbi:MAG: hypothetical protein ACE5QF_06645 [Thermoplasmata archaeon]
MEREPLVPRTPSIRRRKELLKKVLDVDVDEISRRVVMQHHFRVAVETASCIDANSRIWRRYSKSKGGIILLLRDVRNLGTAKRNDQNE